MPLLQCNYLHKRVTILKRVSEVPLWLLLIGNPVRSLDVAEWATGYTRWLAHLGYTPQSAHPWSLGDLQTVLEHLDARIASATGVPLLRLHRDAFTMTILWETCSRGATAVSWCLDDLWLASGVSPVPLSLMRVALSVALLLPPLLPLARLHTASTPVKCF
jgi:hypothetical protein